MITEEFKYHAGCEGEGCSAEVSAVFLTRSKSAFIKTLRLQGWRIGKYVFCSNCSRAVRDDSMIVMLGGHVSGKAVILADYVMRENEAGLMDKVAVDKHMKALLEARGFKGEIVVYDFDGGENDDE